MIKRIVFPLFSLILSLVPLLAFFILITETGTSYLIEKVMKINGFDVNGIRGTLYEGEVMIENINSSKLRLSNTKIRFEFEASTPFLFIQSIHATKAYTDLSQPLPSTASHQTAFSIPSLQIDQLNVGLLKQTIFQIEDIKLHFNSRNIHLAGMWGNKPLAMNIDRMKKADDKFKMTITITHDRAIHHLTGLSSHERLHIQSDPTEDGHVTIWHDNSHQTWSIDVDYALVIDKNAQISSRFSASIDHDKIKLAIDKLKIQSLSHTFSAHGYVNIDAEKTELDLQAKDQNNQLSLSGSCHKNCHIQTTINAPDLSVFSRRLAGNLQGEGSITGSIDQPEIKLNLRSDHLRSSSLGADKLTSQLTIKPTQKLIDGVISGTSISFENQNLKTPWKLHTKIHKDTISGQLETSRKYLIRGFIDEDIDLRIIPQDHQGSWSLNHDINVTYHTLTERLNIHPVCLQSNQINFCINATLGQDDLQIDLSQIDISTHLDTAIPQNSSRQIYIKDVGLTGSLILSRHKDEKIHIKPNLFAELSGGALTNIIPGFMVDLNYYFDTAKLESKPDRAEIIGTIESVQGPINISVKLDNNNHIIIDLNAKKLQFQDNKSTINLASRLNCYISATHTNCSTLTDIFNSQVLTKTLQGTKGLPEDVFIDSPVHIKNSAAYPINFKHQVILSRQNEFEFAGVKGSLEGNLDIDELHGKPLVANGTIRLKPAIFSIFGHVIPLKKCSIEYSNSTLDLPILDIQAEKSTTSHYQITKANLSIFGRPDNLQFELTSSPAHLGQFEIIKLFLSGKQNKSWKKQDDEVFLNLIAQSKGSKKVLAILEMLSDMERSLQLDQLSISPNLSTKTDIGSSLKQTDSSLAEITLGKEILPNLSLRYQFQLNSGRNDILSLTYALPQNLLIEIYFSNRDSGANLLYRY